MNTVAKPVPQETDLSRPYWDGARRGVLKLQCCTNCGQIRHYPRPLCGTCYSFATDWVDASGLGTLFSWTVAHHVFHPGFAQDVPYILATVALAEGPRALGRLEGVEIAALRIGLPLLARFTRNEQDPPVLSFAPQDGFV